ncbi:MAG: SAM-dependent chlorinase/fluorinase, partial [Chloroflexota bacterium]
QPRYWRQEVSATFHGRDIFAPAAAHLSLGVSPQEMGRPVTEMVKALLPPVEVSGEVVRGQVVYMDRFGNLITNLRREHLPPGEVLVEVAGRTIRGLSTHYQTGAGLVALIGSSGYLEVAAPSASATRLLRAGRGVRVVVRSA